MTSARILSRSAAAAHSWSLLASASAWRAASCLRHSSMCSSTRRTILTIIEVRCSPISFPPRSLDSSQTLLLGHQPAYRLQPDLHCLSRALRRGRGCPRARRATQSRSWRGCPWPPVPPAPRLSSPRWPAIFWLAESPSPDSPLYFSLFSTVECGSGLKPGIICGGLLISTEHSPRCTWDADSRQNPPIEAPVARHPPGHHEQDRKDEHQRVRSRRPREDEARVHERAEEGRDAGEEAHYKAQAHQDLTERHQIREQRGVRDDHVLQETRVPSRNLRELPAGLLQRALSEALDGSACPFAYPAAFHDLSYAFRQPQGAQVHPDHQPHRGHPGVGEQKAGYVRFGDLGTPVDGRVCVHCSSFR